MYWFRYESHLVHGRVSLVGILKERGLLSSIDVFFFFNDTATTEIYTLSLHDALPICDENAGDAGECFVETPGGLGVADLRLVHQLNRVRGLREREGTARDGNGDRRQHELRSEEHTSELQSLTNLVCRLLLEKKKESKISSYHEQVTVRRQPVIKHEVEAQFRMKRIYWMSAI